MSNKYKAIVFDWDGTLYDSISFIVDNTRKTAKELKLKVPQPEDVRPGIGLIFEKALKRLFPEINEQDANEFSLRFHQRLQEEREVNLFQGVEGVIEALSREGYLLALASGRRRKDLDYAVKNTPIERYFLALRGADETESKPHPRMLLELMDELEVAPESTLMIGDTEHDIKMASHANVDALAVSYGVQERSDFLSLPVLGILSDIRELLKFLS